MATDHTLQSDISKFKREPDGSFKRPDSVFRDFIEVGGKFAPEKGRYHLYVSTGCPWATRTLIVRQLKGLEDFIDVTVVSPRLTADGWPFGDVDPFPGAQPDPLFRAKYMKELYLKANPDYTGRFTVPVVWDKKTDTIVNNESSEIIRMFNTAFNDQLPHDKASLDLYPTDLRSSIDEINQWVYDTVNNGVYRAGFATTQTAYEAAVVPLFESLDRLEKILQGKDYLVGDQLTEADVRLFVTIARFDVAYVGRFKCNLRTIRDGYPALHLWLRKLYWNIPAFKDTCDFKHIKTGYYTTRFDSEPYIVPMGPLPNILPL